jgi:hypothetical protein
MNTKLTTTLLMVSVLIMGVFNLFLLFRTHLAGNLQKQLKQPDELLTSVNLNQLRMAIDAINQKQPFSFETTEPTSTGSSLLPTPSAQTITIKAEVLNGSGIPGEAADLKNKLEEIPEIKVISLGNFQATTSSIIKSKKNLPRTIKEDLLDIIRSVSTVVVFEENLAENDPYDLRIILGKRKTS